MSHQSTYLKRYRANIELAEPIDSGSGSSNAANYATLRTFASPQTTANPALWTSEFEASGDVSTNATSTITVASSTSARTALIFFQVSGTSDFGLVQIDLREDGVVIGSATQLNVENAYHISTARYIPAGQVRAYTVSIATTEGASFTTISGTSFLTVQLVN